MVDASFNMASKKDHIDQFHDCGVYLPTRTIMLSGEINEESYVKIIKNIHVLDSTNGGINVKINSPGGDVYYGMAIYDAFINCKNNVRMIAYGGVESMGSVIFQSGDERWMTEHSFLMIHEGEHGQGMNHIKNFDRLFKFTKQYCELIDKVYLTRIQEKNPKYTKNQLSKLLEFDTMLMPQEAINLGLADQLGDPQ